MPVTIKQGLIKYKNGNDYIGINTIAEQTTEEQIEAIEAKGEEVLESIPDSYEEIVEGAEHIVEAGSTQPTNPMNRLWIKESGTTTNIVALMADLLARVPNETTDGTYTLKCTVSDGEQTFYWEADAPL